MSARAPDAEIAFRVADRLGKLDGAWDVYGERARRFDVHLNGPSVELARGPIVLEGYSIRLMRARAGRLGTASQASTDATEAGVRRAIESVQTAVALSDFPASSVELPASNGSAPLPEIADPTLWNDPTCALEEYVAALLHAFERERGVVPSFGAIGVTLTEVSVANSSGLEISYPHTLVDVELGVKAYAGPEGPVPGEYWVLQQARRLEIDRLPSRVPDWSRYARDARAAVLPPTGATSVVIPPSVLDDILPAALAVPFSGVGRLNGIAPEIGEAVGATPLELADDPTVPWAVGSAPVDDEGTTAGRHSLVTEGKVASLLYDVRHGAALGARSTGSGWRRAETQPFPWARFTEPPSPEPSTLVIPPGTGGTDNELCETAGDGVWLVQIGYPSGEPSTSAFGGEIRMGYRIRHGKLAEPVRGGTVGGRILAGPGDPSVFRDLASIGSQPRLRGRILAPALLVKPMELSGEGAGAATAAK